MYKLLIALGSVFFLAACGEETVERQQQTETAVVSAPAELVSLQDINISPPSIPRTWEYKIEYLVRENTLVKEGDMLIKFDGQNLRNQLLSRQSELDAERKEAEKFDLENEAELEQLLLDYAEAKKNMNINRRKVEITDVSRSDIERKKQQAEYEISQELYKQAEQRVAQHRRAMEVGKQVQDAKVAKAQFRVDEIKESIEKLTVKAPKSGMVTLVPDGDDEKPAIGDTVYMGRRILSLPSLERIAVKVEFDESITSKIGLGDKVRVTLDAYPERSFDGQISELGQSYRYKSRNNMKIVFDAWVKLDALDLEIMRPGMKATVELVGEQA